LPSELQAQLELTLLDLDRSDTVEEVISTLQAVARTVDTLPEDVQAQLEKTVDSIADRLPEVRMLVADATTALEAARGIATSGESLTANLGDAGRAWEPTFRELVRITGEKAPLPRDEDGNPIPPPEEPDWNGNPDLINLRGTANGLVLASQELHPTVVELGGILASGKLAENLEAVDANAVDLVDTLTWRAALLIVVFFAAALAYRVVTSRWLARSRPERA
jgi:hypothetical protein